MTKARDLSKIAGSITNNKNTLQQNQIVSFENINDTGTEGTKVSVGSTGQRGTTTGQLRYNSTTNNFEFRDNTGTTDFLSPPQLTSVDVNDVQTDLGGNQTFVITGKNFKTGAVIKFIASDASEVTATTTTRDSATQITAVIARSQFTNAKEPYDIHITNGDALTAVLADVVNVDNNPVWQTNATLPIIYNNMSQIFSYLVLIVMEIQ